MLVSKVSRFEASRYLFNANFSNKRISASFCANHPDCGYQCDLEYVIKAYRFKDINITSHVHRRSNGSSGLRSDEDMVLEMFYDISLKWKYVDGIYRQVEYDVVKAQMLRIILSSPQNQLRIKPLLLGFDFPDCYPLPIVDPVLVELYKDWDRKKLGLIDFRDRKGYVSVPSLKSLILSRYSAYNMAFGVDEEGYKRSCSTRDNLYDNDKLYKLIDEFNQPTHTMSVLAKRILRTYLGQALDRWYDWLGTKRFFKQYKWTYSFRKLVNTLVINLDSSSGLSMHPRKTVQVGCVTYTQASTGSKRENCTAVLGTFEELHSSIVNHKDIVIGRDANSIILKQEVGNNFEKTTPDARANTRMKGRFFFIPHFRTNAWAQAVGSLRHGLELGERSPIKIGMKWWYGGAQKFAEHLRYDSVGQVFSVGDFKYLDKTIKRQLLALYVAESDRYIDIDAMSETDRKMYEILLKFTIDSISVKIVHVVADYWTVMDGVMPSGHFETSHGDSWIVGFMFSLMVTMKCSGHKGNLLRRYCAEKLVIIVVYGDDHVISCPSDVYDLVGCEAFKEFCSIFGMMIRDEQRVPFFSELGAFGELIVTGVCFLQRYFVRSETVMSDYSKDFPAVLPVRPAHKNIIKLAYGSGSQRAPIEAYLALTGHAYDTMGTNAYSYDFLEHIYDGYARYAITNHENPEEELQSYLSSMPTKKAVEITRLMKKNSLTLKDLSTFPTMQELHRRNCPKYMPTSHYHNPQRDMGAKEINGL